MSGGSRYLEVPAVWRPQVSGGPNCLKASAVWRTQLTKKLAIETRMPSGASNLDLGIAGN